MAATRAPVLEKRMRHGCEEHDSALKDTLLHTSVTDTKGGKISAHMVAMKECESEGAVAVWRI